MNKLATTLTLTAALVFTNACGVSPSGPDELPSIDAQAAAPSSSSLSTAQTSGKGQGGTLPVPCAVGEDLILEVAMRDERVVEVSSNYRRTERGCPGLAWELDPSDAEKELLPEPLAFARGEGLRLFHADSARRGVLVIATAPDGQIAKLRVDFHVSPPSPVTPAAVATSAGLAQTSRKRQILPPAGCVGADVDLTLEIVSRRKGVVEVASNLVTGPNCPALEWVLSPSDAVKELTPETFAAPTGEGLRIFTSHTTLRGVRVIATAPDGQMAKLYVDFATSPTPHS